MRASAQLAGPVAEAHDTNGVAVLLLEEMHRALRNRLAIRLDLFVEGQPFSDLLHHAAVHVRDLVPGHRAVQRDVERGVVGTDPRALLHYVLAELPRQRLVGRGRGRRCPRDPPRRDASTDALALSPTRISPVTTV